MTPDELVTAVEGTFGVSVTTELTRGELCVTCQPDDWIDVLTFARDTLGCAFFDWLSAVDEPDTEPPGVDVVSHVYSPRGRHRLLLRTRLARGHQHLPTATTVYKGANWHERETAEMFGVTFDGHPNPLPLLLPDGFVGTPLRKEFVLASRVAKQWPGEVNPGQSLRELAPRRRRNLPPGVPDPDRWGPSAKPVEP
ncbi:NADH-quinone oxidoreductase subunit C [Actinophytocola sp.]|jgi:NADH-quinone oxidoreductase subunit C|uniref:NADH-quinone oxidoreductase subunit C n=1 Tax=Actinophytocola sp. TaxID=1872138 RepID=UPI002ED951C7